MDLKLNSESLAIGIDSFCPAPGINRWGWVAAAAKLLSTSTVEFAVVVISVEKGSIRSWKNQLRVFEWSTVETAHMCLGPGSQWRKVGDLSFEVKQMCRRFSTLLYERPSWIKQNKFTSAVTWSFGKHFEPLYSAERKPTAESRNSLNIACKLTVERYSCLLSAGFEHDTSINVQSVLVRTTFFWLGLILNTLGAAKTICLTRIKVIVRVSAQWRIYVLQHQTYRYVWWRRKLAEETVRHVSGIVLTRAQHDSRDSAVVVPRARRWTYCCTNTAQCCRCSFSWRMDKSLWIETNPLVSSFQSPKPRKNCAFFPQTATLT